MLHDAFVDEFATIADVLGTTPAAARKLASRARANLGRPAPQDLPTDGEVVDAFMAAARGGDLPGLLRLLAPDVEVRADGVVAALTFRADPAVLALVARRRAGGARG